VLAQRETSQTEVVGWVLTTDEEKEKLSAFQIPFRGSLKVVYPVEEDNRMVIYGANKYDIIMLSKLIRELAPHAISTSIRV
jgi:hypothetical protein